MKIIYSLLVCVLIHHPSFSQQTVFIKSSQVTVLPAADASLAGGLTIHRYQNLDKDPKVFAVEDWRDTSQSFKWNVNVPEKGAYKVAILLAAKNFSSESSLVLELSSGDQKINVSTADTEWDKKFFSGLLRLNTGMQKLQLRLTTVPGRQQPELSVYSIEIATEKTWKKHHTAAESIRARPSWLDKASYGLFFHWNARSQPEQGNAKSYINAVQDFDVKKFSRMVYETGADFVVFTTSWDLQTFPAPLKSLDELMPGNTTPRDLIADLADALADYNIKLMVYCNFRINRIGWKKEDRLIPGKTDSFFDKISSVYREIGERYAGKIGGVWVDDGMGLYPHNASFEKITRLIKHHDKSIVVGYNSWIYPRFTDFQDFYGGEYGITLHAAGAGNPHLPVGGNGYYISGPQQGLKATFCGLLEPGDWTHTQPNQKIPPPSLSADNLITIVREAMKRKNLPVMNVSVYQDGSISPDTYALLKQLKEAVLARKQ
ncbi:MAG TPA: hypothetical protein PKV73_11430 [Agriterribacter sp.]|nr:hypothetical protein [Chitinophagaceae bacterium]HRP32499.1 hypothetical protein [Agriterribacter sp.]